MNDAGAKPRRRRGLLVAAIVVAIVVIGIAGVVTLAIPVWPEDLTPDGFRRLILSWGMWAVAGSVLLMVVHSFVPFPAEFVAIANGMCFGVFWGSVITWVGAMLGALAAFALSRRLGRPLAARMVRERDWRRIDDWLERYGGEGVLLCRFIPLIAFNLINYAAGLTRIPYPKFIWATGLGILPMTILMAFLGAEMQAPSLAAWLIPVAGVLLLWLIARRLLSRRDRGRDAGRGG